MLLRSSLIILCICIAWNNGQFVQNERFRKFPMRAAQKLKDRFREKVNQYRERNTRMICYDSVGCVSLPHKNSPLQKIPEDPMILGTKFYLFTRKNNLTKPEIIYYDDDGKSLKDSNFNVFNPLKVLIHGYTSKWNEKGALVLTDAYLKLYDCNVLLMDWKMGARGPHYASAAANTEIVGRQLGILLVKMVENGLEPKTIHLIGFSLGAHVAGTASESLKNRGHLIGRITGLDPASPLFRNNYFRENHKKLDRSDADLVDVLHTDSSPFITDGFGLWQPIGHVDFFPNGGQEQPGCTDPRSSIVLTSLEGGKLSRDSACSHIRAFHLFVETITNKLNRYTKRNNNQCQFIAYNCPGGLPSFEKGHCFPLLENKNESAALPSTYKVDEVGQFGEDVSGEGVMYFSTRNTSPYCGTQLQASVHISQETTSAKGLLQMTLAYLNGTVTFQIETDTKDFVLTGTRMNGLSVAEYKSLDPAVVKTIRSNLYFFNLNVDENTNLTLSGSPLYIDKIVVRDMYGNRKILRVDHSMANGLMFENQTLLARGDRALIDQVVLGIGIAGACRREELTNIKLEDVKQEGAILVITIPDLKIHTSRKFVLCGKEIEIYKKYIHLRPSNTPHNRLFTFYSKGKCKYQPVGINTIGKIPFKIAQFLKLNDPTKFTSHCFRRTSATLLADAGGDIITLKRHGGWKSSAVAEIYVEESVENKLLVARKISTAPSLNQEITVLKESSQSRSSTEIIIEPESSSTLERLPSITIGNVTNSSISIKL